MRQNFGSERKMYIETTNHSRYFHNTETMGAVHHALSRRPLSSGTHSDTIDLFPTLITTSGTLVFFMILSGGAGKTKFVSNHIFKGRIKNIHDNQMGFLDVSTIIFFCSLFLAAHFSRKFEIPSYGSEGSFLTLRTNHIVHFATYLLSKIVLYIIYVIICTYMEINWHGLRTTTHFKSLLLHDMIRK